MSPTGTDKRRNARRRNLALVAGIGVMALMPLTANGQATSVTGGPAPGEPVVLTKDSPASVKRALATNRPVVVAFLLRNVTEDEIVRARLTKLRKDAQFKDTQFLVFRVTSATDLGDLPDILDVRSTPMVTVIQSDNKLQDTWRGLVDQDMIAQSIRDARAAVPSPMKIPARKGATTGNKSAIKMIQAVNRKAAKMPGMTVTGTGSLAGTPAGVMELEWRLAKGRTGAATGKTTTGDGVPIDVILNRTGLYSRPIGATCWIRDTSTRVKQAFDVPLIPLKGVVVGRPVPVGTKVVTKTVRTKTKKGFVNKKVTTRVPGPTMRITVTDKAGNYGFGRAVYTINRTTNELVAVRTKRHRTDYKVVTKATPAPKPDKIC